MRIGAVSVVHISTVEGKGSMRKVNPVDVHSVAAFKFLSGCEMHLCLYF